MDQFQYTVRTQDGRTLTGVMEAETRDDVVRRLRQQKYFVTTVKIVPRSTFGAIFEQKGKIKAKHMALLCRQFAIELHAGMTLVTALELLEQQAEDVRLTKALRDIRVEISGGSSLTQAVERQARIFPQVFVNLLAAGEAAGALPEVLDRLAIYYEREDELRKKVGEALMYPGIIFSVAIAIVLLLIFVVLPMLISNFAGFGIEPPRVTQVVLGVRDWMVAQWYIVLGAIAAAVFGMRRYLRTPLGRRQRDRLLLKIPIIGQLQKMMVFSRFSRTLSLLLNSGIAMVQALNIVERVLENVIVQDSVMESRTAVNRGEPLSESLRRNKLFPLMLTQMVLVGEETGNLESTLEQVSDYYDREVNYVVARFTKALEPIVMLILAVVVLFILISVYLPMMQMITQI